MTTTLCTTGLPSTGGVTRHDHRMLPGHLPGGESGPNAQVGQHDPPRSSDPPQPTGNQTKYQRRVRVWLPEVGEHGEPRAIALRARTNNPLRGKEAPSPTPRSQWPKEGNGHETGKNLEQQHFPHFGGPPGNYKIFPLYHEHGMNGCVKCDQDNAGSGSPPPMYQRREVGKGPNSHRSGPPRTQSTNGARSAHDATPPTFSGYTMQRCSRYFLPTKRR